MTRSWTMVLKGMLIFLPLAIPAMDAARPGAVAVPASYAKEDTWAATLLATRARLAGRTPKKAEAGALWARLDRNFPIPSDWMLQDAGKGRDAWFAAEVPVELPQQALDRVIAELGQAGATFTAQAKALAAAATSGADRRWLDLYLSACEQRRAQRLTTLLKQAPRLVYAQHWNMGASHYAYTEGQSDAQAERHFYPGTALLRLDMDGIYGKATTLIADPGGVIRDPNVSWDGTRVLFAWKKSDRQDDYHLYEMAIANGTTRQLTSGLGCADYEGAYLPDGGIVFNSTRPVQTVDCWWTEVSNLYTCDQDGRHLRRLGYDQVHTNFPQVMDDGRVIYTRWEYNDRGQLYVQGLFQMGPDGTGQTEFYGNNSWFPTSLLHARGIPGTQKVVAIASGHHSSQAGKLCIIDTAKGRQENEGVTLLAPERTTKAVRIDSYGQNGDQWMYPVALNEREFIVSFWPDDGHRSRRERFDGWFSIFYMDAEGRRELLASDPERSCCQAVPLAARPVPPQRPSAVDHSVSTGSYYMQDVYVGPGLAGVERGVARKLRVVSIAYRAAGVRSNNNAGPAGSALVSTPVGGSNTAWDPKTILGDATIHPDGSAFFAVPARTPVYFQVLDVKNRVINTMRSWSTLMPGERFACTGCHESKNSAPPNYKKSQALSAGLEQLAPFYGPARGFSFRAEIQPILDRHCVSCHDQKGKGAPVDANASANANRNKSFSLLGNAVQDRAAGRRWTESYLALTGAKPTRQGEQICVSRPLVSWTNPQSTPEVQPPYSCGSSRSGLLTLIEAGHYEVALNREEMDKLAAWIDLGVPFCRDYVEANCWTADEVGKYLHFQAKRLRLEEYERRGVEELLRAQGKTAPRPLPALRVEFLGADDQGLVHLRNDAEPAVLSVPRAFRPGERILVIGPRQVRLRFDDNPEIAITTEDGFAVIAVPGSRHPGIPATLPEQAFAGTTHRISARTDEAGTR
jgi:hypothetical protein